jgi:hypothetical protein
VTLVILAYLSGQFETKKGKQTRKQILNMSKRREMLAGNGSNNAVPIQHRLQFTVVTLGA